MKADETITEKQTWKKKNWPELRRMSGSQEGGQTDTKSKSQKHCWKHTRNSSTESTATIYELQKIMNIEAPLNIQHFKTYELEKKKNMNIEGSFKCP